MAENSFAPVRDWIGWGVETHGFTVGYFLARLRRWGHRFGSPRERQEKVSAGQPHDGQPAGANKFTRKKHQMGIQISNKI